MINLKLFLRIILELLQSCLEKKPYALKKGLRKFEKICLVLRKGHNLAN